ncbi:hypothetical protein PIROE2DRAFT_16510 [Piromyces sp. E2]|nr:hypothetical protein PIROE2DRAFT_16510 [Piromyces sp. E2]|eukprot:OUM58262.1 hypothetical protein PIROE2DRAFT_16510 [Piromyces sp. E2]
MRSSFGAKFGLYKFDNSTSSWVETNDKNIREMIITPSFNIGSLFGTIMVYFIMDSIGRSKSLCVSSVIYFIGVLFQVIFDNITTLCIGRVISGVAAGIATTLCLLYKAEISPKQIRGTLGVFNSLSLEFGKLLSCFYETLCLKLIVNNPNAQWRVAIAGLAIPTTLFLIIVWFLPETPRDEKNKELSDEYSKMSTKLKAEMAQGVITWKEALQTKSIVYRLIIAAILQLLRMLVGVSAIAYFSTQIYSNYLGIPTQSYGAWLATLNSVINLIFSLPAVKYIEGFGRRKTLLCSSFVLGLSMILTFFLCFIIDKTHNKVYGWICVIVMYVYTITDCSGWNAAIPVWQAEVFPIRMRAKANSIGWFFKYVSGIIVSSTSTTLMKYLSYYTFWVYASFCIIAFIFIYFTIRETRGLSLEEMENLYGGEKEKPFRDEKKIKKINQEKKECDITNA